MTQAYVTTAFLKAQGTQIKTVFGWSQRPSQTIAAKSWLVALEIFVHGHDIATAYQRFQAVRSTPISESLISKLEPYQQLNASQELLVLLQNQTLTILGNGFKSYIDQEGLIDLSPVSQETPQVLLQLFAHQQLEDDLETINSFEAFQQLVSTLEQIGLFSPAIGSINWGDFRRLAPLCHITGFTRGNPIDRYYLQKFVDEIREQVVGDVLEVGGVPKDREFYQFDRAKTYRIMNLEAGAGVDLVGDVHDPDLVEPDSLDSLVIFNVLEHCYAPWIAVENIHRWLKPGGKCFCMVPNAQRLHDRPGDFWRPLPDGVNWLFRSFSQKQLYVYGNPLTVLASFHGVGYEELTPAELDAFHPDYPVSTCIVATK
ncbi:methyltransferase [filamentous cyanobacterium CCP2]|nr:methyltransferase [filamentous cyanobacterium CCP2]